VVGTGVDPVTSRFVPPGTRFWTSFRPVASRSRPLPIVGTGAIPSWVMTSSQSFFALKSKWAAR
jgi:hypothetical protein